MGRPLCCALALLLLAASAKSSRALASRGMQQVESTLGMPEPAAYFPLTEESLASALPDNSTRGSGHNLSWEDDPVFGRVMACDSASQSYVAIPGVAYGEDGPFAVAVWAKFRLPADEGISYLYSHNSSEATDWQSSPNVLGLMVPDQGHPSFGVIRAVLRDSTDNATTAGGATFFVDSNGCVANQDCGRPKNVSLVSDMDWHLVGLTTHPEGGKGYQLYVDGQLAGEANAGSQYTDETGASRNVTGGEALALNGSVTLCARSDLSAARFFTGSLVHLAIYDTALSPDDWRTLYAARLESQQGNATLAAQGFSSNATDAALTVFPDPACTTEGGASLPCSQGEGSPFQSGGAAPAGEGNLPPSAVFINQNQTITRGPAPRSGIGASTLGGQPLCGPYPISGFNLVTTCSPDYVCAPLPQDAIDANFASQASDPGVELGPEDLGVCAFAPDGVMLPDARDVPTPMAFFPLASQKLESWPVDTFSGVGLGASVVSDPLFGASLKCSGNDTGLVALNPVQYGASGSFSVNLWARPGNQSGDSLAYMFSHQGTGNTSTLGTSGWGPNQVQIYLPQRDHVSYGVLRAYARDANDEDTGPGSAAYLDSDGSVAYNGPRPTEATILDGGWHMVTVTSQPEGTQGYRLYLDGELVNQLQANQTYYTSDGYPVQIGGGGPLLLNGDILLCSRADNPSGRHFDGQLAYLGLYDRALSQDQVSSLYSSVQRHMAAAAQEPAAPQAEAKVLAPSTGARNATRFSVSGEDCQFPAFYNGQVVYDCVDIDGTPYCQTSGSTWEACEGNGTAARYTTTGAVCVFPTAWQGRQVNDCVDSGGGSICQTADGTWAECAPESSTLFPGDSSSDPGTETRLSIQSTSGRLCQLPLMYHGAEVDACVGITESYLCWTVGNDSSGSNSSGWDSCPMDTITSGAFPGPLGLGASSVPLFALPTSFRTTVDGGICALPTVYEGEILDDCVMRQGTWACLDSNAEWQECDMPSSSAEWHLSVANRTTEAGSQCVLPAAYNGQLWFDCVQYALSNGTVVEACPGEDAVWSKCAPLMSVVNYTTSFHYDTGLPRSQPGGPGQLCIVTPSSGSHGGCQSNFTCVPMPELGGDVSGDLVGWGFCAPLPEGGTFGVLEYLEGEGAVPLAYFPLTGMGMSSLTLPAYSGLVGSIDNSTLSWVEDDRFVSVPRCTKADYNAMLLDNVPYAVNGSWAVSLWMRRLPGSNTSGDFHQYLYSHSGTGEAGTAAPNQVLLLVPEASHPAYGVARVLVRDSNDVSGALITLDSDGAINSDSNRTASRPTDFVDVNDGAWHMVTVSTLPQGGGGYALYLDGERVAALEPGAEAVNGSMVVPPGGDPLYATDNIYLCSRSDLDGDRFFDGSVVSLALFDRALTPDSVRGLYQQYGSEPPVAADPPPAPASYSTTGDSGSGGGGDAGLVVGVTLGVLGAVAACGALAVIFVGHYRSRRRGRFERYQDDPFGDAAMDSLPRTSAGFSGGGPTGAIQLGSVSSSKLEGGKELAGPPAGGGSPYYPGASAGAAAVYLPRAGPGPHTLPAASTPQASPSRNPFAEPGGGASDAASVASAGTSAGDVEIDPGKRTLPGFKKSPARVILPSP